jgi:hypothetical protein
LFEARLASGLGLGCALTGAFLTGGALANFLTTGFLGSSSSDDDESALSSEDVKLLSESELGSTESTIFTLFILGFGGAMCTGSELLSSSDSDINYRAG